MPKLTSDQLKKITAEAKKIREKGGTVKVEKYKMSWRKAVQLASKKIIK